MADPVELTFGEVGPQHIGMHLVASLPGAERADVVLDAIRPCRGPDYVSLAGRSAPLGIEVAVDITRSRDTPLQLFAGPIPAEAPGG